MEDDTSVRVAVRIRPQIPRELIDMCRICTSVTQGEPQVWLGSDKAFTFDYVFDIPTIQPHVYEACVQQLIEGCFEGYNATVLAYGQTGSGKTYTMGTGFDVSLGEEEELGIVQRAVEHLFSGVEERRQLAYNNNEPLPDFKIHCQFLELYNEEIIDLFDTARDAFSKGKRSSIRIHEDASGGIYTVGVTTRIVSSKQEALQCLKIGALSRTTASTQMNVQSSRSHAIFTLHIKQQRVAKAKDPDMEVDTTDTMNDFETLTAKFHFVDLAGSERLKRTGATGERAKEGISINCGLLALGNVISALGDITKRGSHVPYRDSKLTRLLQDSLGGNSRTVMIACISPSDRDFMETLNTLKYANRARNIKNKVVANQDKNSKTIAALRMEIQHLQLELMEYKQGKRVVVDGEESINDMYHENTMLQSENNNLRIRIKALQETVDVLTVKNTELLADKAAGNWIATGGDNSDVSKLIQDYIKEIEELRGKLLESEHVCQAVRRSLSRTQTRLSMSPLHNQAVAFSGQYNIGCDAETESVNELLEEAKKDLERMKEAEKRTKRRVGENFDELSGSDGEEPQDGEMEDSDEVNEDDDDDEVDDDDTSDSDTEVINQQYRSDLAELTNEISIKQKLIDQLEMSQKRLETLRHSYEEKLVQLQNKIKATQEERDKVLANLGSIENLSEERAKKIKGEYEKKLHDLTSELKKIQSAKKEHAALLKNQNQHEKQIRTIKSELADMKKAKVRLMNTIKEEATRHKEAEQKRNREIAQLKKESRVRENQIRTLEAEKRMKETVLRRKQEEVSALRRLAKPMSDKVAGRVPGRQRQLKQYLSQKTPFSPKVAKSKWQHLEKHITVQVLKKKTVSNWDIEMERRLKEREKLGHKLEKALKQRMLAASQGKDELTIRDMEDQIETLKANIDYVQEEITNCQKNIVEAENTKEGQENLDINSMMGGMTLEETRYLIQKLVNMTVSQSLLATQQEARLKEMEAKMVQVEQNNSIHEELLEHMLKQQDMDMYQYLYFNGDGAPSGESAQSSRSISPVDGTFMVESAFASSSNTESLKQKKKVRRRTAANPEELLFGATPGDIMVPSCPILEMQDETLTIQPTNDDEALLSTSTSSTLTYVKSDSRPAAGSLGKTSPRLQRRAVGPYASSIHSNITQHSNNEPSSEPISPTSPTTTRKGNTGRDENVFSRLTSSSTSSESSQPNRGTVESYFGKPTPKVSPLICTHVAKGHSKAVLNLIATDTLLFTASKDRTAKIWDLQRGEEILTLDRHPNNVVVIRYCERTRQVFTGSSSSIKVWDLRGNTSKCIKTLQSSGIAVDGSLPSDTPSRMLRVPPGEHQINDFALDVLGTSLYCAAGNIVRVWDLRKFSSVGKLSGGHQAAVMCLMVTDNDNGNNLVVTGSKDHTIKIFEVPTLMGGVHPARKTLEPPHYDGIQSLAQAGNYFFSGSRDACIKKWDLRNFELKQAVNQAHKDWVCGLCVPYGSQSILSCCRAGYVRQWSVDSCLDLGHVRAHDKPVHAITNNRTCIFTASDDHTVRIWKLRNTDSSADVGDDN